MKNKNNKLIILSLIILISISLSLYLSQIYPQEKIMELSKEISFFIEQHFIVSILLILLITIIFSNSPLPVIAPSMIFISYFYGFELGFLLNIFLTLVSVGIGFILSRYLLKDLFESLFKKQRSKFDRELEENGIVYIFGARVLPIVPYFMINYLSGISRISFKKYLIASFLGIVPTAFMYSYLGDILRNFQELNEILSFQIFIISLLLAFLSQLPVVYKKMKKSLN